MEDRTMILIVDDQLDTCEPLRRMLTRVGYDVQCLSHGRDALQFVANQTPDLVLLDLMMPDLSGFDVLQSMREREATADVPVVMYSSSGSREIRQRAAKLGANDFITKGSLEWPEMLAKITGILPSARHARGTHSSAYA
jgi:two-component system, cell cycle sensor histidine kinase PleC